MRTLRTRRCRDRNGSQPCVKGSNYSIGVPTPGLIFDARTSTLTQLLHQLGGVAEVAATATRGDYSPGRLDAFAPLSVSKRSIGNPNGARLPRIEMHCATPKAVADCYMRLEIQLTSALVLLQTAQTDVNGLMHEMKTRLTRGRGS